MRDSPSCEELRELAPELALGIVGGEQRADALEHAVHCSDCRALLHSMAETADELLLLAPPKEPPAGFDERTLARLDMSQRRWGVRRLAALAAAAVLMAAVGASVALLALRDEVTLAGEYEAALAEGDGEYFASAGLERPQGVSVGNAYFYEGRPSWAFVVVRGPVPSGVYRIELESRGGESVVLDTFGLGPGIDTWGGALPGGLASIDSLSLVHQGGRLRLTATYAH